MAQEQLSTIFMIGVFHVDDRLPKIRQLKEQLLFDHGELASVHFVLTSALVEAVEAAEQAKLKCVEAGNYYVITKDHDGNVGEDILVKTKQDGVTNDCKYVATDSDFEIKGSDAVYFKDIKANAMVVDIGTGPSGRSFKIYDLKDKNVVTEKAYFEDFTITDNVLTYFGLSKNKADAKKCKGEETYVVKKTIDLKTYSAKESKETKCVATQ